MCNPEADDNKQADAVNTPARRRAMTESSKQQKGGNAWEGKVQGELVERTKSVVTGNARRLNGDSSFRQKDGVIQVKYRDRIRKVELGQLTRYRSGIKLRCVVT